MPADLKVIGAGFGRTGTDSMRDALELLGIGPCHHMKVIAQDQAHCATWSRAIATNTLDWDQLLDGFQACVDWPTAYYWPQLINAFPKAKVLLTWRDAQNWWRSFEQTILKSILATTGEGRMTPGLLMTGPLIFGGQPMTKDHCIAVYNDNVARVKHTVPADRLHIHTLGDGWDALCAFLDVPVPKAPFPRGNSTQEYHSGWPSKF
ncbi:sulfotransferase family protein [Sulfitobacter aestuariivivens]|uniref:Sulfotransferase family protein n=1 Tax=Sulfitobacter aestuariivivens TaxID=2766981 RepID=A0A927D5D3_9RHOB|nr:sulfotransferase family protein [Sulfitobacter aestuariivivens]MBD3665330.1 sulfotransferase family protein [Sulfitobacter aestuariivivens]